MKMKKGTWALSVLLAVILVSVVMVPVSAWTENDPVCNDDKAKIQDLFRPVDEDVHTIVAENLLESDRTGSLNYSELVPEIMEKYDRNLEEIVYLLVKNTGVQLDEKERIVLKEVIVGEHFGRVSDETLMEQRGLREKDALIIRPQILGVAECQEDIDEMLAETGRYSTFTLAQCYPDVYGGSGLDDANMPYNVNGGNNIYEVRVWIGSGTYQLVYYDEDHPSPPIDSNYDAFRLSQQGTLEDFALFYVHNSKIEFNQCWSNDMKYAWPYGIHGSEELDLSPVLYISNIWNHDIGTCNNNPGITQLVMSVPYITYP